MRPGTPVANRRLGHEGDEHAVALGDLLEQHPQEHQPIRHPQHVGVVEIQLELRIRPFRHDIVEVPAQAFDDVNQFAQEAHRVN